MAFTHFTRVALLAVCVGGGSVAVAADAPATVPPALHGTYDLVFDFVASPASPVALGTRSTFVIGPGGLLCVDGKALHDPVFRDGNTFEGIWKDGNVEYAVSDFSGDFNEVNLLSSTGAFLGQYSGSRVSTDTACVGGGSAGLSISSAARDMFDLGEKLHPTVFGQGSELRSARGYIYRYFASSGVYVGLQGNDVYVMGAHFGNAITFKGTVSQIMAGLRRTEQARANTGGGGGTLGPIEGIDGEFTLTVTGRYVTPFIAIDIPKIVLEGLPAPDPGDDTQILEPFKSAMGSAANIDDSSVKVIVINNNANRVTFDVSVEATLTGLGRVNYELRYDYVRQ